VADGVGAIAVLGVALLATLGDQLLMLFGVWLQYAPIVGAYPAWIVREPRTRRRC
jgi:hypothetical protein